MHSDVQDVSLYGGGGWSRSNSHYDNDNGAAGVAASYSGSDHFSLFYCVIFYFPLPVLFLLMLYACIRCTVVSVSPHTHIHMHTHIHTTITTVQWILQKKYQQSNQVKLVVKCFQRALSLQPLQLQQPCYCWVSISTLQVGVPSVMGVSSSENRYSS